MSDPVGTTEYARANAMQDGQAFLPVQAIQTISPNGKETTAFGNRYGEAEKETNQTADGSQKLNVAYEQDAFGQLIRKDVTDQTGEKRTWDYRYSPDGQLLYFHDPENNVYQYGYDALGNLITVTENGTVTTQNHYNGLSWKLSEKDVPSGKTETYNYDATGKVTLYKDNAGNSHESGYTPFHDLATYTTRNSAGTIVNKETKTYVPNTSLLANDANSNGADTSYTSPNRREISYSYDPYQRLKEFTAFGRSYEVNQNDDDDLMDELVYPDSSKVTYAYDAVDRLKEVRSSLTGTVTYAYTIGDDGETESITYPNGFVQEQHQDSFGQVDNLAHKKDGVSVWNQTSQYSFGNMTEVDQNGTLSHYRYDKIDRLIEEGSPTGTKNYTYDPRGNRKTLTGNVPAITDANLTYDGRNRLQSFSNKAGDSASYKYFGDGLLATKLENGKETNYVYLNGKVIEELDENGTVKARNIWGNQLILRKDYASQNAGYYLFNSHGDVVSIVNEKGAALNTYAYDAWAEQMQVLEDPRYSAIDKARVSLLMLGRTVGLVPASGISTATNVSSTVNATQVTMSNSS